MHDGPGIQLEPNLVTEGQAGQLSLQPGQHINTSTKDYDILSEVNNAAGSPQASENFL